MNRIKSCQYFRSHVYVSFQYAAVTRRNWVLSWKYVESMLKVFAFVVTSSYSYGRCEVSCQRHETSHLDVLISSYVPLSNMENWKESIWTPQSLSTDPKWMRQKYVYLEGVLFYWCIDLAAFNWSEHLMVEKIPSAYAAFYTALNKSKCREGLNVWEIFSFYRPYPT